MSPKPTSRENRELLRTQILNAARTLFVQSGIEAASMREIAKKINYSATTLYHHFADKEALMQAVCDEDLLLLASAMQEITNIPDLVQRMLALGHIYAEFARHYPNHYRLLFMTPRTTSIKDNTQIQTGNPEQDAYAHLKSLVQEAFDAELFKPELDDAELLAQTLWASIHGVCSLEIALGNETWINWKTIESRIHLMQSAIFQGLLRHPIDHSFVPKIAFHKS